MKDDPELNAYFMSLSENTVIFNTVLLLRRGSKLKSQ
jgi:hypothetical protein